jgi:hypothetical protein
LITHNLQTKKSSVDAQIFKNDESNKHSINKLAHGWLFLFSREAGESPTFFFLTKGVCISHRALDPNLKKRRETFRNTLAIN